jgi:hypothetical protein
MNIGQVGAMGNQGGAHVDVMSWYMEIPTISRLYLTGAFLTTAACGLDLVSPFSLYFNWDLVFSQGQVWRLITSYLFFGVFSVDFLFHMYFLVSLSLQAGVPCCCLSDSNPILTPSPRFSVSKGTIQPSTRRG